MLPSMTSNTNRVTNEVRTDRCALMHLSDSLQHRSSVLTCFFSCRRLFRHTSRQKSSLWGRRCYHSYRQLTIAGNLTYVQTHTHSYTIHSCTTHSYTTHSYTTHSYTIQLLFTIPALFWFFPSLAVGTPVSCLSGTPAVVSIAAWQPVRVALNHVKQRSCDMGRSCDIASRTIWQICLSLPYASALMKFKVIH